MQTRYSNLPGRREEGKLFRISTVYPQIPESTDDIYLTSVSGDRFDVLAQEFYGNSKYWWIIASNNPTLDRSSLTVTPGIQIRIPLPLQKVLDTYTKVNKNR
jgi:hypothetical protein